MNWREEAPTTPDEDWTRGGGVGEKREEGKGKVSAGDVERKGRQVVRVAGLQLVRAPRTCKSRPRRPPRRTSGNTLRRDDSM